MYRKNCQHPECITGKTQCYNQPLVKFPTPASDPLFQWPLCTFCKKETSSHEMLTFPVEQKNFAYICSTCIKESATERIEREGH